MICDNVLFQPEELWDQKYAPESVLGWKAVMDKVLQRENSYSFTVVVPLYSFVFHLTEFWFVFYY